MLVNVSGRFAYRHPSSAPHPFTCLDLVPGVMGNVLGTNYREPTGGDWAAFCGLTFDLCLNGRMETFNVQPNIKEGDTDPGSNWSTDMFITLTPFIACCICVTVCERFKALAFQGWGFTDCSMFLIPLALS